MHDPSCPRSSFLWCIALVSWIGCNDDTGDSPDATPTSDSAADAPEECAPREVVAIVGRHCDSSDAGCYLGCDANDDECISACIARKPDCEECLVDSYRACVIGRGCADEWAALDCCAEASCPEGLTECVASACATERSAFTTCAEGVDIGDACPEYVSECVCGDSCP